MAKIKLTLLKDSPLPPFEKLVSQANNLQVRAVSLRTNDWSTITFSLQPTSLYIFIQFPDELSIRKGDLDTFILSITEYNS